MLLPFRSGWLFPLHHYAVPAGGGGMAAGDASSRAGEDRAETPPPTAGVLDELSGVLASGRAMLSNFFELLSLEARRAGLALMWMVAWGIVGAVCLVAAWLGLMAALALWIVSLGVPPIAAVIAVAVINCVAGAALICWCIGMSRDLLFSATRRQLAGNPPKPPAP